MGLILQELTSVLLDKIYQLCVSSFPNCGGGFNKNCALRVFYYVVYSAMFRSMLERVYHTDRNIVARVVFSSMPVVGVGENRLTVS